MSAHQRQFLDVVPLAEARRRLAARVTSAPLHTEWVPLEQAWRRIAAEDVHAPHDVPNFDRSLVDGYAVRARDTGGADERSPVTLERVGPAIEAGRAPEGALEAGCAWPIATGACMPRGADAVVMVEHTHPTDEGRGVRIVRAVTPGERVGPAGADVARGQLVVRAGTALYARETAVLAACGVDPVPCIAAPRVVVLSTGTELTPPGQALKRAHVFDANSRALADAAREVGANVVRTGLVPDDAAALRQAILEAYDEADLIVLSGGTSKGDGDLCQHVVAELGEVLVHGVALKPGKPLLLAMIRDKPLVVLPGFPTSALFTFHAVIAPLLRGWQGCVEGPEDGLQAQLPHRLRSEAGRTEFELVRLARSPSGWLAVPLGKGSGSITTFAQADGFIEIAEGVEQLEAGASVEVLGAPRGFVPPELTIAGSHCMGLDAVLRTLRAQNRGLARRTRVIAVGSRAGLDLLARRACQIAPCHLLDGKTQTWNQVVLPPRTRRLAGYARAQGIAQHPDAVLQAPNADALLLQLLRDPERRIANRNLGSGTRVLVESFLALQRLDLAPPGWHVGYRTHTAVANAVAQGRADWGICLRQAAVAEGLHWTPWQDEQYDFAVSEAAWASPPVRAFRKALAATATREALRAMGFSL